MISLVPRHTADPGGQEHRRDRHAPPFIAASRLPGRRRLKPLYLRVEQFASAACSGWQKRVLDGRFDLGASVRSVKPGRQRPQCLVMDTAQMGRCDRAGTRWIPGGELPPERPDSQVTRKPGVSRGPRQPPGGGRPAGLTRQRQATRRPKTVRGRRAGRTMSCMLTRNGESELGRSEEKIERTYIPNGLW